MRALLVTSQVTYVPRNYGDLFVTLLAEAGEHVAGAVFLRNLDWSLAKTVLGLYALGCPRVATSLVRNTIELPLRRREKLFTARNLPVLRAATMNTPWMTAWIRQHEIDLVINLRTRCIYQADVLTAPKLGCLNVHHGLLPEHRGAMCDLYALSENRPAGFTIHVMTERLDAGRILLRSEVSDGAARDYIRYLARTGRAEGHALAELLQEIACAGALPVGEPNTADKAYIHKTPRTRAEIARLKTRGMLL